MRTLRFVSHVGLVLLAMTLATGSAWGQDLRTWKDASGKFSIKAKFVSNNAGTLTLAREDGEEVEIELKKLCDADQKYVAALEKENKDNPFKSAAKADPFKTKKAGMGTAKSKGASGEAREINADWSDARNLILAPDKSDWQVTISTSEAPPAGKARAIMIPAKAGFFEKLKGMVVSADGKKAVLGYTNDPPGGGETMTRVVLVDLEKSKTLGAAGSPGMMAPLALSDDGTQVLMKRDEFGFGKADRLELWTLNGSGIAKGISFFPYGDAQGIDRDVKWAAFLTGEKALTVSNKGKLVLWDLGSAKAIYSLGIQDGATPALSADRKLLAFTTGKEVGVLDVESGSVLGLKGAPNTPFAALAFSPSGKKFAVAAIDKLWAFDTATGNLLGEMLMTGMAVQGEAFWTDEDHVLVGHQYLLDVANQVKLWQYQGAERAIRVGLLTMFLAENGHQAPGALILAPLPQPSAKAMLARAMIDPEFFVLKPGAPVKVVVDQVTDAGKRAGIASALAEKVAAVGAKASPNATLELVASTEVGKQREIDYRTIGRGFGTKSYKVQEYISRVKLVYQGKTAWETSSYNIPHFVHLRNGQTMDQYLKEQEKPNYEFFSKVELPKLLTRPTGTPTLGQSRVSPSGIR